MREAKCYVSLGPSRSRCQNETWNMRDILVGNAYKGEKGRGNRVKWRDLQTTMQVWPIKGEGGWRRTREKESEAAMPWWWLIRRGFLEQWPGSLAGSSLGRAWPRWGSCCSRSQMCSSWRLSADYTPLSRFSLHRSEHHASLAVCHW